MQVNMVPSEIWNVLLIKYLKAQKLKDTRDDTK
jgi:hypothetical protein